MKKAMRKMRSMGKVSTDRKKTSAPNTPETQRSISVSEHIHTHTQMNEYISASVHIRILFSFRKK